MNLRRQLYKQYRLEGLSQYRAAIKAGYSHGYAWNANRRLEKACNFEELLSKHGLDDDSLSEIIKEGTKATKSDGKPDYYARHKYIETSLKVKGKLKDSASNNDNKEMQVIVIKSGEKKPETNVKVPIQHGGRVLIDI